LSRLDHPAVTCLHGRLDPAVPVIDDSVDLVVERFYAALHFGLDARDVAIARDGELAEVDEKHPEHRTERCVFQLTPAGLELVEVAPGTANTVAPARRK
jgi:hypothetical protein